MNEIIAQKLKEFKTKNSARISKARSTISSKDPNSPEGKLFSKQDNKNETIQRMLIKQKLKENRQHFRPVKVLKESQLKDGLCPVHFKN